MSSFTDWFASLFGSLNAHIKAFFAGPGGDVVKAALGNMVKIAGAEASSLLVQMAQNQVAGKPVLTGVEWDSVASDLKTKAVAQGIVFTETMIDFAISQAVMANP